MSGHYNKANVVHDMKPVVDTWTILERGVMKVIASNFKNFKDWYVISDMKRYKPSMDPFVFGQKIGKIPEVCEVYYKGNYVTQITTLDSPSGAETKIQDGLIELIQKKKGGFL